MLLQLAAQDIGQLTDIEPRRVFRIRPLPMAEFPGGGDFASAAWSE